MKLLSPTESKDQRETQNARLESKSATLDEAIVSKRKELLALDEEFLRSMQEQRLVRLKEDAEWQQRNEELRAETESLEQRKKHALLPLVEREKEIETKSTVLLQREQHLSEKEQETADNLELLEMRLDEASDRLESVRVQEKELSRRRSGVLLQEKQTSERTNQFNSLLFESLEKVDAERRTLAVLKATQEGRETYLNEWQKRNEAKERDLVSRETRLSDRERMLERSVKEINFKKS